MYLRGGDGKGGGVGNAFIAAGRKAVTLGSELFGIAEAAERPLLDMLRAAAEGRSVLLRAFGGWRWPTPSK